MRAPVFTHAGFVAAFFALLWSVFAALNTPALAQTPGAGDFLRQMPAPAAQPPSGVRPEAPGAQPSTAPDMPASGAFVVRKLVLTGEISVDVASLQALVREAEGQTLTLAQLQRFADRITEWYRARGFPFARAYIPAQTIDQGQVEILVLEGRYGELRIDNRSGVQGDGVIARTLGRLRAGDPIRQPALDRTLLLLQDIPGVDARGALRPGAQVGSSDLDVRVDKAQQFWGSALLDNSGGSSLGRKRLSGTLGMAGLVGTGDTLTLNMLGSGTSSLKYHRIAYETLVDGDGTRVGAAYSDLLYRLIGSFSSLEAHGTANVSSLWLRHPLLRSRDANLNLQLQQEHVKLRDRIEIYQTYNDRHLRVSTLTLSGDLTDDWLGGGQNTASLSAVAGNLSFDDAVEAAADASGLIKQGNFNKLGFYFNRLQTLNRSNRLALTLQGQHALRNLDSSQKMSLGGPNLLRAFDVSALSGDSVSATTLEWQRDLPLPWPGQWQSLLFWEQGRVRVNDRPVSNGANIATLEGAGIGMRWSGPDQWRSTLYLGSSIGPVSSMVGGSRALQAWLEISKGF